MTSLNAAATVSDVEAGLDPLCWFTQSVRSLLAAATAVAPEQLPEPYRTLLAHDGSMTLRLETWLGAPVTLEILSLCACADRYARWIVLQDARGRCLEIGGICLDLRRVSPRLCADIREGALPLGRLLSRHGLIHRSVPYAFLECAVSPRVQELLQMAEPAPVFGRRTGLRANGQTLGMVVELLPRYERQRSPRALLQDVSQPCFRRNEP